MTRYIVELHHGCWLAAGRGDPSRTLVRDYARLYDTDDAAAHGLKAARKYRPFNRARVVSVSVKIVEVDSNDPG